MAGGRARTAGAKERWAWLPELGANGKPAYLAIVDSIATGIKTGRLLPGERLPAQRALAEQLGLDYTTVARAYGEARRRGLIDATVGRGSFVRAPQGETARGDGAAAPVDLSMNLPPEPDDPALLERMRQGIGHLQQLGDLRALLRYQEFGGSPNDREAGIRWLAPRIGNVTPDRLMVCPGAQSAILAALAALARPGDVVCTEALTYPGFRAQTTHCGVSLLGLPFDEEGVDPDAFEAACRARTPKALYSNPTLQNPTTTTISLARRQAIVAIARRHGVAIIEDDAYGHLPLQSPPAFAALAPELTYYVSGMAKCVASGLRIAYIVAPDARHAARLAATFHATTVMAAPLMAALATRWIADGTADAALAAIRREAIARQRLAAELLDPAWMQTQPEALHFWLRLPEPWSRVALMQHLRSSGIGVVVSDAFIVSGPPPEAVRVCLGGPAGRAELRRALETLASALDRAPAFFGVI
ncbi:MAG TPA: PLP-dependent aminotransferase family protein [Stellaceae bacterium]|nr:PLP-dependent aminotransferase family protein [Stellaceae bacterium]